MCVVERDVAVLTVDRADRERATVGTERLVEDAVAALTDDPDRNRAAEQRSEQVAAGCFRVVEVHTLAGEEERPVKAGIDQRLRAETLRDRGRRLSPRLAPR